MSLDWDTLEAGDHDFTMVSGPIGGVSIYYCEKCGAILLAAPKMVFHPRRGSLSLPERCAAVDQANYVTLKSKLDELRDESIERLRGI